MPQLVTIQGERHLQAQLRRLVEDFPEDAVRALERTAARSATRVRREVARDAQVPQRLIKDRIKHYRDRRARLAYSVWVGVRSSIPISKIPGARFDLRSGQLRAGRVRVKPFRATMPSGHTGLFVRKPGAEHRKRPDGTWTELPIEEPRVRLRPFAERYIERICAEQMREFFPVELRKRVERTVRRQQRRGR